jgi:tRNA G18 (ribose-2'-O)-methylase SpoU
MRRALTTPELRRTKPPRDEFLALTRRPITIVLDGVTQNYNIGVIFRLCEPMLGMANSLNVATTAAILLYWLSLHVEEPEA